MSRILLVDDDVDLAELVTIKLQGEGHQVHSINTGEGAFELAKQVKPEIALLDIMLPKVTGYQLIRRIRKDPELYPIGILALSALGEEPEMIHGLEQGADDYLAKPFRLEQLIDKLGSIHGLLESVYTRHAVTNLPGTEAVKREINHRLAREMPLAAIYLDMVGFKPYCQAYGEEGQKKALTFMAQLLGWLTKNLGIYESFTAHLGGEHFVVLLHLDHHERYCQQLMQTFDAKVKDLYAPEDAAKGRVKFTGRRGEIQRHPLMALSIGVAHNQFRHYKGAKALFEVLAQTRQKAVPEGKSAVFIDRRKTDR